MDNNKQQNNTSVSEDTFSQRIRKVNELRDNGIEPYGERFPDTVYTAEIKNRYLSLKNDNKIEERPLTKIRIAGRLTAQRIMGKSTFGDIKDSSGRLQIYGNKNELGDDEYGKFKKLDIGDIVGLEGDVFETKKGEITLKVKTFKLLSKSLRTLPEKWHGLTDIEQRYRQRYLDLIVNDSSREVFRKRFAIIREIRKFLESKDFVEVETPMLQPIAGGAAAKPFKTFYEALHIPVYMRIAPELYLKRLLVGGFEKIYELNRNFRNEGISKRHNPEFTMIEIYQAFGDCTTMMNLVEELITTVAQNVLGTLQIKYSEDKIIDLTPPWRRIPYKQLIKEKAGDDWFNISYEQRLARARELGLNIPNNTPDFEVTNEVYEKLIEQTLIQPVFVTRLPAELVPLAKKCPDDPSVVDVFELEINGQELSPGYSELNDPIEQRKRFESQLNAEGTVSEEKCIDEDFLTALEYGMPPAGGMGIGIDRLVMTLTAAESIRDVILFPQLKPKTD